MKRYLLFSGDQHYPLGGWEDFQGSFDTPSEAIAAVVAKHSSHDWWEIVDTEIGEIVQRHG